MGNNVQKVLQRRGDKEGKGFRVEALLPFLLLFLTYLGLLFEFPLIHKASWFVFGISTIAVCAFFHFKDKAQGYSTEFLFSLALMLAGTVQTSGNPWLKTGYFPLFLGLTAFYGRNSMLSLLVLVPFLELKNLLSGQGLVEEIIFLSSLAVTVGVSLMLRGRAAKKTEDHASDRKETDDLKTSIAETKPIYNERVISDYLEATFRPDEEICELLNMARSAIFADSLNLFVGSGGDLRLRCSTDGIQGIIPSDNGIILLCYKEKRAIVSSDISENKIEPGYLKKDSISSLVAVPVMDGQFPLGVVAADSARFHAFSSADRDTLELFSNQIMRVLRRERFYPQMQRSYATLKILNEESSKLLSSLKIDIIGRNLIDAAGRIAPSRTAFFAAKGREFELLCQKGLQPPEKRVFSLKKTVLDMAVKNLEAMNLSDVRDYRLPVMPFKTADVCSVIVVPLLYEREILGILVLLSEDLHAFSPQQKELLEVLVNQASISMANARFHAEIERLAVTDGLTGLFNHRHFQERLLLEFQRLGRFTEPLSLLLLDIDYFKKVNDAYGHPVGDAVLRGVAGKISKIIRTIDIPARYGGEEFAVVLLNTDAKGALNMAERLRNAVSETGFHAEDRTFNVTLSIGISTYPDGIKSKEELIERADKALYHAKRTGRNRSILWSEVPE
ncbi:MAG TPA: diguanylate cyclase [Thermodesulfovibrionales bacterium]|nr:diguanylate cyclase [Thermodesulfovibrionales bacterium]